MGTFFETQVYIAAVLDCYRRQKDVALVSLGNILHQVHYSDEAAVVMHAAIDISHELNVNHFTLGNIYAVTVAFLH